MVGSLPNPSCLPVTRTTCQNHPVLDRARWQPGGGPSYHEVRRLAVVVGGATGLILSLVALRVGFVAAAAAGLPEWPIAIFCAGVAAVIAAVVTIVIMRS